MLDKKDLQEIGKLMDVKLKNAFSDFYENIFIPFMERNEKEHQAIRAELKEEMRDMREDLSDYIKDHETRIRKLEKAVVTS